MSEKKVVVITGAAQGIGFAAVKKFLKEGWAVAATDIKKQELDEEVAKLVAEGHVGKKSGSGYYDWSTGARPVMDESRWTGTYDPDLFMFIEANEATKLFEEGVCSLKECDTAMQYGYNTGGPVEYIQKFEPEYVAGKLQEISDKYGYKIFAPTETIKSGAYKY